MAATALSPLQDYLSTVHRPEGQLLRVSGTRIEVAPADLWTELDEG